jgi:hypothetical protein
MAQRLFGWWLFDAESSAVIHETTGQVVRLVGRLNPDEFSLTESENRIWMRFEYQDREARFPILIEWRNVPSKVRGRPLVWRVDYVRSAALWRRETGISSTHPPYGLWRRVDDCLTDALASWPAHPKTGAKPKYIGLNGGWLNGAWASELYRCVWCSTLLRTSTETFQNPSVPPLAGDAPSPWVLAAPSDSAPECDPSTWNVPRDEAWSEVLSAMRRQHYLTTEDRSRLLVALPKAEIGFSLKRISRFLYIDRDIVTDALHMGIYDFRNSELPKWTAVLAKNTPFGLFDRSTGASIPWATSTTKMPTGSVVHVDHAPYAVTRKLAHATVDAWLSHPETAWVSSTASEPADEVSSTPSMVFISDWELGGSAMPSKLEAGKSLEEPLNGPSNQLRYIFDEYDGIVRSSSAFQTEGYWRFDPSTQSLYNSTSSQRVRFLGTMPHDRNTASTQGVSKIFRLQYEDDGNRYPIAVLSKVTSSGGTLQCVWFIDHDQSLLLWQQLQNSHALPAFGLWQRVNECVVDALLCWPEIEATGPKPISVVSMAGWCNGGWSSHLRRRSQRGSDHGFAKGAAPLPPSLSDVTAQSFRWTFVDSPRAVRGATLANVQQVGPGQLYLPPNEPLTGFEADVPYLIQSDGQAVMFPAGLKSSLHRGEDYMPGAFFCYADTEVFLHMNGDGFSGWGNLASNWKFNLGNPFHIGLRDRFGATDPAGMFGGPFIRQQSKHGSGLIIPSPAVSQRITTALIDGWLTWAGSPNRLLDDPTQLEKLRGPRGSVPAPEKSGIDLGRKSQVRVEGGYLGGRFNTMHSTTAWMQAK